MQLGIFYPSTELVPSAESIRSFSRGVESLGFDHLAAGDHVLGASRDRDAPVWGPYDETDPFHDPLVLLGHVAALADRIGLCTNVLVLPQRQTALVARQAADVALLSGGRLRLGVGVGWNRIEYDALGQPFGSRGRRADEQLPLLRRLWSGEIVTAGTSTEHVDRAALTPAPRQPVPLWIGGNGEAAFGRAARHADGFLFAGSVRNAAAGLTSLRTHLDAAGRTGDFGLELVMIPPAPDRGERRWPKSRPEFLHGVAETLDTWRGLGGSHATVFTTWMGFTTVREHLDYAERLLERASFAGVR